MGNQSAVADREGVSEAARKGLSLYDEKLKSQLEPTQNGRAIALHVDTGDYVIADSLPAARREMFERYPDPQGRILCRVIGPEVNDALIRRRSAGDGGKV